MSDNIDLDTIANKIDKFSGSDIVAFAREMLMGPVRRLI